MIVTINLYSSWNDAFGDYLRHREYDVEHISILKCPQKRFRSKKDLVINNLYALLKLLPKIYMITNNCVYCTGVHYAVLLIHLIKGRGKLYIYNFYLHSLGKRRIVKKMLHFLLNNRRVTVIVQTPDEVKYYKEISDKIKILFVPYCSDAIPFSDTKSDTKYVFTGGYTNRDYSLVLNLARKFPLQKFVVVASQLNKDINSIPENVTLYKDIPAADFNSLLAKSYIVIVPLKEDVGSSGQMLCLSAMRNSKPIIYADVSSINYYFTPPHSGFPYQIGSITSLSNTMRYCLEHPDVCNEYGENAYKESLKYTTEESFKRITEIMNIRN